jgi:histidine triad (HIT) family protein
MADCVFCGIAEGRIPATTVRQDDDTVAFRDLNPQAPTHILVIPRRHIASVADTDRSDADILGAVLATAIEVAAAEGLDQSGYRLVINHGADGGQSVGHLHVHLFGGRPMSWPPG